MTFPNITPFDSIEAAQEYLALLSEVVADNRQKIDADIAEPANQNFPRSLEVLKLTAYNLKKLEQHLKVSRQTLNNLRKLRRFLSNESAPSDRHFDNAAEIGQAWNIG